MPVSLSEILIDGKLPFKLTAGLGQIEGLGGVSKFGGNIEALIGDANSHDIWTESYDLTLSSAPDTIRAGQAVTLSLGIRNESPYDCELWIGASAIGPSTPEIHSVEEDRRVQLPSAGLTNVNRQLTFPPSAQQGRYNLRVNLWFGKVGDPDQSERICNATLFECITVRAPLTSPQ